MYADRLLLPWLDCLRPALPGLALHDAHTHTGADDPDGARCSAEELLEALTLAQARAVVFPLMEPDGYRQANDRVLTEAADSQGRLVAFCRIDPNQNPVAEAERCLAAGARGIKLHPRAERFALSHPGVRALAALAHERRLPLLVHAGRGIPALGPDALILSAAYPQARIVLAHAAVCDLAWIWRPAREQPNLLFDTAWWSPADLLALFTLVPPGQILFGSDAPLRHPSRRRNRRYPLRPPRWPRPRADHRDRRRPARTAAQRRRPPRTRPAPACARPPARAAARARLHPARRRPRPDDGSPPRRRATRARPPRLPRRPEEPESPILTSVAELLDRRTQYASTAAPLDGPRTAGFHLIAVAAAVARTPTAPLPALSTDSDA